MGLAFEAAGWIGAFLVLVAFFLVARQYIRPQSKISSALNLVGAGLLVANTVFHQAYAPCALNAIWAAIAGVNLLSAVASTKRRETIQNR